MRGREHVRLEVARQASRRARIRSCLPPEGGGVAITFDDGPDPEFTPAVLDQLGKLGVRATFFAVGHRAARHPELVRRVIEEGHALGSHSYSHAEPGSQGWRIWQDFRAGRAAVETAANLKIRMFRPPKGFVGTGEAIAMRLAGLVPWLWTIDPEDWAPGATAEAMLGRLGAVSAGDVVLLHDGLEGPVAPAALDRSETVALLPGFVEVVRQRGLRFETLRA